MTTTGVSTTIEDMGNGTVVVMVVTLTGVSPVVETPLVTGRSQILVHVVTRQ